MSEEKRKSARGNRAKKRDEDVLEGDGEKPKKLEAPTRKATRRDQDQGSGTKKAKEQKTASPDASKPKRHNKERENLGDPVERGEEWLGTLFEKMKLDLKAKGTTNAGNFIFNVSGPDSGGLVGRSRQSPRVLAAMQTLLAEHLGRSVRGNVIVDLGGLKKEQQSRLTDLADQLGKTARKIGKPLTIAGLTGSERKAIHRRLEGDKSVDTESVDQGIFRKLRVQPD